MAVIFLTGCGNLQSVKVAEISPTIRGHGIEISGKPASKDGITPIAQPLGNEGLYLVQSGGGSLAVGLLFGPIGALANAANVAAESEKLAKSAAYSSLLSLKPVHELNTALRENGILPTATKKLVSTSPYLVFYVDNERKNIYPVAGLRVDAPSTDGTQENAWKGQYLFAIDKLLSAEALTNQLSDNDILDFRAKLRAAYIQLQNELSLDLSIGARSLIPTRQIANVNSTYLKATQMGFAGFTAGDVSILPGGSMSVRVNMQNYGPAMDKSVPYYLWYFPSASQYTFELGPEPRKEINN